MPFIPQDKQGHINLGTHAGLIGLLCHPFWYSAILTALFVGLAKEGSDYLSNCEARAAGKPDPHSVEFLDVVATVAGGCWVSLVFWLVK